MGKRPEGNRELYKYIGHQIKLAMVANKWELVIHAPA